MDTIQIGNRSVSRLILGTNPVSGFSHQGVEMDRQMVRWFTVERIKSLFREAESLGVNTVLARTDHFIMRLFLEYWNEGGKVQWFAQTCPGGGPTEFCIRNAAEGGAKACHIHGGVMDNLLANNKLDEVQGWIAKIRDAGMLAGIAGHNPNVFEWAEEHLDVDYYMCSYYNSMRRDENPEHVHGAKEWFWPQDREIMAALIQRLSKPVIHYKILAAGRNDPAEAFSFAARAMRPSDAVCIGIYNEDKPGMLREDVDLLEKKLAGKP